MTTPSSKEDTTLITVISFLIPILGAIFFFIWSESNPKKSKAAGRAALWGVGFGVLLYFIAMGTLFATF